MTVHWRRPILVGGIGLSFGLWFLDSLHHSLDELGGVTLAGIMGISAGLWWWQRRSRTLDLTPAPISASRATAENAIHQAEMGLNQLIVESPNCEAIIDLKARLAQLTAELDRQELCLAVAGGKSVGKTALIQALSTWNSPKVLSFQETAPLFTGLQSDPQINADLVLFVTAGDLTDPEFQVLSQLLATGQRLVLLWNKQDQYLPTQHPQILQQLHERLQGLLEPENIIAIAAEPKAIKVRQHHADGSAQERVETQTPQIQVLTERLNQLLAQESQTLVWGATIRSATTLKSEAKVWLNRARRDRALPLIEQYQYIAAAAAFANPVAALDLLATAAISTQLVVELGAIYQQKFSFDQAKAVAGTLASQMIKMGLIELSTQTITGVLKSNAVTYVAGGVVQGVSAAYFTRIAGLSLIEYFQAQDLSFNEANNPPLNLEQLRKTLQAVFQQNQQVNSLQAFIKTVLTRLVPGTSQSDLVKLKTCETLN